MPDCDNFDNTSNKSIGGYKDVVIIGNGPSGLSLSYFLSGHWPHWNKNKVSDEYLQMRLEYCDNGKSLLEQDLEYLCDGLEGRSNNPVALLFDSLKYPDSDLGLNTPSCLSWKYDPLNEIDHVVIGKAAGPGGAWNDLDGSQLTISPSKWMELPDMKYENWERQSKSLSNMNAGLVFSSKNSNFSEDNSLLNANCMPKPSRSESSFNLKNYLKNLEADESPRASMHDVRNYYRDYVKQKNLNKYLLNNATVTSVRQISCNKLAFQNKTASKTASNVELESLYEVTGLIDKRDRKKASSLSHGEIGEFRFICKHLVLACGANDLHNDLHVKGENFRYILRTIRELEDKIKDDLVRLRKDPLLIVGSGLSAADAILLAQQYQIKVVHVIRRSVNDPNLVFKSLPQQSYPEYHQVYAQMQKHRYQASKIKKTLDGEANPLRQLSQNDLNNMAKAAEMSPSSNESNYVLYDEHQVELFTSKRTCKLKRIKTKTANGLSSSNNIRHLHSQKQHHQHHQLHQRQLKEFDEELEATYIDCTGHDKATLCRDVKKQSHHQEEIEIKISFACVLIGYAPDLEFLPPAMLDNLAVNPKRILNTKENPILVDVHSHETVNFKRLYAMGPLIGDNFVRFGTGGALAITSSIVRSQQKEKELAAADKSTISTNSTNNNVSKKIFQI